MLNTWYYNIKTHPYMSTGVYGLFTIFMAADSRQRFHEMLARILL